MSSRNHCQIESGLNTWELPAKDRIRSEEVTLHAHKIHKITHNHFAIAQYLMNYLNITLPYFIVKAVNLPLCSVILVFLQVFKIQISVRYCVESLNAGVFSGVY